MVTRIGPPIVAETAPPNLQEVFKRYAFGPFVLDAGRAVLCAGGEPLPLGPRAVATLAALVERAGEVVTKDELLDRVWPGEDVNESNVAQSVYLLRKALREHGVTGAIATVARRGYRFTAAVELLAEPQRPPIPIRLAGEAAPVGGRVRRWLSAAVALALLMLAGVPAARAVSHPPPLSARGAELYRLGRYYWNLRTPLGLATSTRLFHGVVASDPRSPLGHAGLADAALMTADYEHPHARVAALYAQARREIALALALDRGSAAAHASLGMLRYAANHDESGSEAEFRRAIELDPNYAIAHHWYGTTLLERGWLAEATRELHAAAVLDPVSSATGGWLAEASYFAGRYRDAITYARRALDLDPHRAGALRRLGLAYELTGDVPRAIETFQRMRGSGPDAGYAPALLAEAYARAGRRAAARAELRDAVRLHPRDGDTALAMLALGERERGLAILAVMRPDSSDYRALVDPRLAPFRDALRERARRLKHQG
ncbi:MAG: winged helix-turn-helix domain-containing protein [Candidatus Eremiobacteraeota bacterium]|nr:winged helix-turn-helix domain-containing protein [Candidatus Eremiobacteraeota bacterium]